MLNSLIVPIRDKEAEFKIKKISVEEARDIVDKAKEIKSAIGHELTAKVLSTLLGTTIEVNRISIYFNINDEAIVFVLKQRLPEGKVIMSQEEIEKIGYEIFYVRRVS